MTTHTVTIEPSTVMDLARSLQVEFKKVDLLDVKVRAINPTRVRIETPVQRLADYHFVADAEHCSWTTSKGKIILQLKTLSVEQRVKNHLLYMDLFEGTVIQSLLSNLLHGTRSARDFWLELWEKEAIIEFHLKNPLEGYRRLTFMMLDADVAAVSPASVWRVLKQAGLLSRWKSKPSRKGTGFEQPLRPHQQWHIDVSYINLCGTFYYLCSILDGFSRFLVHWDLRESMRETDIEVILQRAKEKYPEAKPRIISDNGPQFIRGSYVPLC